MELKGLPQGHGQSTGGALARGIRDGHSIGDDYEPLHWNSPV